MSETSEQCMERTQLLPLEYIACLTGDCDHNTSGDCLEWLKEQSQAERWMIATPEDLVAPPACGVLTDDLIRRIIAYLHDVVGGTEHREKAEPLADELARSAKQGETVTVSRGFVERAADALRKETSNWSNNPMLAGWGGTEQQRNDIAEAEAALAATKGE